MKGEVDYYRRLSGDMAEAEHRAQIDALDDKSAWEELCKIRDALEKKINQPTPPRNSYRASSLKPETSYDADYQNALLKSHRGLSS